MKALFAPYLRAARRLGTRMDVINLGFIADEFGFGLGDQFTAISQLDKIPHNAAHQFLIAIGKQIDELGNLKFGVNVQGGLGMPIYKQIALYGQNALQATRPGGKFGYLGVPMNDFVLTTYTPSRIIGRLGSLAQQTSLIIPDALKKAGNDLTTFFRNYKQNRVNGTVTYEDFQKTFAYQ